MKYIIESKRKWDETWNKIDMIFDTYKDATDYWDKELYLFPIDEYHFRIKELI